MRLSDAHFLASLVPRVWTMLKKPRVLDTYGTSKKQIGSQPRRLFRMLDVKLKQTTASNRRLLNC